MPERRGTILVGGVVVLAVLQVVYEDVLVFLGATGAPVTDSPYVLVGVPLVLFLLLAGLLYGWAIGTSETLR